MYKWRLAWFSYLRSYQNPKSPIARAGTTTAASFLLHMQYNLRQKNSFYLQRRRSAGQIPIELTQMTYDDTRNDFDLHTWDFSGLNLDQRNCEINFSLARNPWSLLKLLKSEEIFKVSHIYHHLTLQVFDHNRVSFLLSGFISMAIGLMLLTYTVFSTVVFVVRHVVYHAVPCPSPQQYKKGLFLIILFPLVVPELNLITLSLLFSWALSWRMLFRSKARLQPPFRMYNVV